MIVLDPDWLIPRLSSFHDLILKHISIYSEYLVNNSDIHNTILKLIPICLTLYVEGWIIYSNSMVFLRLRRDISLQVLDQWNDIVSLYETVLF